LPRPLGIRCSLNRFIGDVAAEDAACRIRSSRRRPEWPSPKSSQSKLAAIARLAVAAAAAAGSKFYATPHRPRVLMVEVAKLTSKIPPPRQRSAARVSRARWITRETARNRSSRSTCVARPTVRPLRQGVRHPTPPNSRERPCADTGMLPAAIVLAAGFAEPKEGAFCISPVESHCVAR
jgi:hypothetical protein